MRLTLTLTFDGHVISWKAFYKLCHLTATQNLFCTIICGADYPQAFATEVFSEASATQTLLLYHNHLSFSEINREKSMVVTLITFWNTRAIFQQYTESN